MYSTVGIHHLCPQIQNFNVFCYSTRSFPVFFLMNFLFLAAMEKQLEKLKQQLEKQCQINQELQRHNKDLGEYKNDHTTSPGRIYHGLNPVKESVGSSHP